MYSKKKHDFSCERAYACEAPEVQESTEKTRSVCLAKEKSFIVGTLEKFKQLADMCFNFDTSALEPHEVQALENFVSYRREHSRLSYGSKKAILERMLELKEKGEDLEACVAYSMRRGYRDLFPLISPAIDRLEDQDFEDQFHPLWEDRASLRARGREMLESMEEYGEEYGLCDFDSMSEEAFGFDDEEFYGKEGWVEL
ncbi:hypothetical protein [Helicobacter heilmannii]|nr:hypothetical protein [Helicobacter heilmannii]